MWVWVLLDTTNPGGSCDTIGEVLDDDVGEGDVDFDVDVELLLVDVEQEVAKNVFVAVCMSTLANVIGTCITLSNTAPVIITSLIVGKHVGVLLGGVPVTGIVMMSSHV